MKHDVEVKYLPDDSVDAEMDQKLKDLFTSCFTKPQDHVFKERRYFKEPYKHRWVIKNEAGRLVAHVGVHDKIVEADGAKLKIGGIAEVCVLPDYRGRGYVRIMLDKIHSWMEEQPFDFSMLFGDPKVYSSSGYISTTNLIGTDETTGKRKPLDAMVKSVSDKSWPADSEAFLVGKKF